MSNPIDVGSVLGGRYKVTATVLTSHDHDLVLDGVDQVLNRPVSILVAGPENTEQVAQSAREVATGERPGSVQVLDLGVTEDATYLITNHTSAADLLDLVVAANPPYVEPFFTDTLGSEIFGQARSNEPEPYDDDEDVDAGYIDYSTGQPRQVNPPRVPQPRMSPAVPPKPPVRPTAAPAAGGVAGGVAGAAGAAGAGAAAASASAGGRPDAHTRPVERADVPAAGPRDGDAGKPKVSLWSDEDYDQSDARYEDVDDEPQDRKRPGILARAAAPAAAARAAFASQDDYEDDEPQREPRSMRWLVGGLLAVVLIAGLIFALTNLGGLFTPEPRAVAPATTSGATTGEGSASATATEEPTTAAPAVPPAIDSISRQGDFEFAANFDGDLVKAFDGNGASYWSDMEFATDSWGGLAPDGVPLVVKLKSPATVSSITLTQLGGSGGNITVYTNDRPSLDGAKAVGTNSFTSTDLNMPLAEPVEAQYVIVSINSLPKLAAPKTRYGYGLRLAEVKVQ
ncbi:ABC transporter substrate-binding protein [Pseudarthrobacter sp. NPDC092419]|uniref:discoidin domain-containing protein n=1 Tax=Pseudarthrobacter sp. NPDC092419 TaxID=3364414 RepID=UPI0038219DF5